MTGDLPEAVISHALLRPLTLYFIVSSVRRDREWQGRLRSRLKPLVKRKLITPGSCRHDVHPRASLREEAKKFIAACDIVLALLSQDFATDDHCTDWELHNAIERLEQHLLKLVPVLLFPIAKFHSIFVVNGKAYDLEELRRLPTDGRAISEWSDRDAASADVLDGIHEVILAFQAEGPVKALDRQDIARFHIGEPNAVQTFTEVYYPTILTAWQDARHGEPPTQDEMVAVCTDVYRHLFLDPFNWYRTLSSDSGENLRDFIYKVTYILGCQTSEA